MILVASKIMELRLGQLACQLSPGVCFYEADKLADCWPQIEEKLAAGEDLLWLGLEGLEQLRTLWLDAEAPRAMAALQYAPKMTMDEAGETLPLGSGFAAPIAFRPPDRYALHGIHEEPRVDLQPLVTAADRFGGQAGVCGVRCRHVEKALTSGSYAGALWLVAVVADEAWTDEALCALVEEMNSAQTGAFLAELLPEYPWYEAGERVCVRTRITNRTDHLQAARLRLRLCGPDGGVEECTLPLMLNVRDSQDVCYDFYPQTPGLCQVEAELTLDDRMAYGMEREVPGQVADFRTAELLLRDKDHSHTKAHPRAWVKGDRLCVGGDDGFLFGTTLYPSTTFFEASYRPLRLARVREEAALMAKSGMRVCRLWCDPWLDETSLRGMRAVIEVLAENGIAAIVTLFSSWTREMWVNTARRRAHFLTADQRTDALIGLYLQDMEGQCLYAEELAEQYADLPSVIWDLSNEFSVVDVPEDALGGWEQPTDEAATPAQRSIDLFRQWALRLTKTIRAQGADQPLHYGVCCWDTGSDNYLCNQDADQVATHLYCPPEDIRFLSARTNSLAAGKPFVLEEFGGTWTEDLSRAKEYETRMFEYLASGFQAIINYEWGMLWTSHILSGIPSYMKFNSKTAAEDLKGFHYEGRRLYAQTWTDGSTGICPWIASSEYGINRSCLPGQTATAKVFGQLSRLTGRMAPVNPQAKLWVAVPFEVTDYRPGFGYSRLRQPLDGLLDRLWNAGVPFVLCQEADLEQLPTDAQTLLFPNAQPISEKTRALLDRHAAAGVCVLTDEAAASYAPDGSDSVVQVEQGQVRVHVLENGAHKLVCLFSRDRAQVRFGDLLLTFSGHALYYEQAGKAVAVALQGTLTQGEAVLFRSDMTVGMDLERKVLLPFGPGAIELAQAAVTVRDGEKSLAELPLPEGVLTLGRDDFGYGFAL